MSNFISNLTKLLLDPRVNHLPFMDNPIWNIVSVLFYLLIVKTGPAFMKNRKPFEFRKLLFCYNIIIVVLSVWMFFEVKLVSKFFSNHILRLYFSSWQVDGGMTIHLDVKKLIILFLRVTNE